MRVVQVLQLPPAVVGAAVSGGGDGAARAVVVGVCVGGVAVFYW